MSHTSTVSSVRAASTAATSAMASALTGSAAIRSRACSPSLGGAHGARLGSRSRRPRSASPSRPATVASAAHSGGSTSGAGSSVTSRGGRGIVQLRVFMPSRSPPTASSTSARPISSATSGSCGGSPTASGCAVGGTPRPPKLATTGAPRCSASTATDGSASTAPPPAQMTTRASASTAAAASRSASVGSGSNQGARRQRRDGLVAEHVGGDVHVDGPARVPHRRGDGFVQHAGDLGGRARREHRLGQRPEQARLVARLVQHTAEPARAAQRLWDLRRHEQHRRAGGRGLAERGQRVGRARPGGDDGGAEAPGGAGPAVGGVDGGLLVPDDQRRPLGHLPEREVVHPREPEDGGGAVHRDGVDDRPRNAPHAPSLTPPAAPAPRDGLAARGTITG